MKSIACCQHGHGMDVLIDRGLKQTNTSLNVKHCVEHILHFILTSLEKLISAPKIRFRLYSILNHVGRGQDVFIQEPQTSEFTRTQYLHIGKNSCKTMQHHITTKWNIELVLYCCQGNSSRLHPLCACVSTTIGPTLCEPVKHGHGLFNKTACGMMLRVWNWSVGCVNWINWVCAR